MLRTEKFFAPTKKPAIRYSVARSRRGTSSRANCAAQGEGLTIFTLQCKPIRFENERDVTHLHIVCQCSSYTVLTTLRDCLELASYGKAVQEAATKSGVKQRSEVTHAAVA